MDSRAVSVHDQIEKRPMPRNNLATSLRKQARAGSMDDFDRLPAELRQWLAQACLPWSAGSVVRISKRAAKADGLETARLHARLDAAERKTLRRDAFKVWGRHYPVD